MYYIKCPNFPLNYEHESRRDVRKISRNHYHDKYELYYLQNGTTKYYVGDEIFYLRPGDAILVPPYITHMTDSESCLYNERILLTFDSRVIDEETSPFLKELAHIKLIHIPSIHSRQLEELLDKIRAVSKRENPCQDNLFRLYFLELLTLLSLLRSPYAPSETSDEQFIHDVTEYIRSNLASDQSLPHLARHFFLNESSLSRKFKKNSGMNINEYITSVRIYHATLLLEEGTHSITEVAQACGYNDSNYFSTVFKKIHGTTPLKY